ncbi:MAG: hypothetical protein RLZZ546_2986 [Bacteroidota bacterium]|jgi:fructose-1,6-bisphosphatase
MKKTISIFIISSLLLSSCAIFKGNLLKPSTLETIAALREILNSSTFKALNKLRKLNTENPESALPEEIRPVLATLNTLGYGKEIEKIKTSIGSASSLVLNESEGLLSDAIKEVDFGDAVSVVLGGQDAATQVLKNAMRGAVKKRYSARLNTELNKTEANKYWPLAAGAYNIFAKNKVDASLSDFLAEKSVDAVFLAMGHEEKEIRKDPASIGKAVVTKVFDYYMKNNKNKIQFNNGK